MCGIAGIYNGHDEPADRELLLTLAGELKHRGPDGTGLLLDGPLGMVNTRLAIIDQAGGGQPISSDDGRYWLVQNGEIYNFPELRQELELLGRRFTTRSDSEVLVNAYRQWGPACLTRLNGDFAFAVWDSVSRELFLARDRFGVRPLYLTEHNGSLAFASEVRALLRLPGQPREVSAAAVAHTFQLWSTLPGSSAFEGITELPAGHWLRFRPGQVRELRRWWELDFSLPVETAPADELASELLDLLDDSVRLRMRADVPVGAYVSGGLDSAAIAALMLRGSAGPLAAFAVGFEDPGFDETLHQDELARQLELDLHRLTVTDADIARLFPEVIELSERPMLRTAPAPLLLLSRLAADRGHKVVLTGEGADELFAGYSIFKEAAVRRFWARDPGSKLRPQLFHRLHPYVNREMSRAGALLGSYYGAGLTDVADPLYSHHNRLRNGSRNLRFMSPEARAAAGDSADALLAVLPEGFTDFGPLGQAQYLETVTFMQGYLLHSQGDRMLMGNGVEGRFPFLDHRVAEFAMSLPARLRLNGLEEKYLLRRAVTPIVPQQVTKRSKRPYRAPLLRPFLSEGAPQWVGELLDPLNVQRSGLFDAALVSRLHDKVRANLSRGVSELDEMALIGVLSTLLLQQSLAVQPRLAAPATADRVVDLNGVTA